MDRTTISLQETSWSVICRYGQLVKGVLQVSTVPTQLPVSYLAVIASRKPPGCVHLQQSMLDGKILGGSGCHTVRTVGATIV